MALKKDVATKKVVAKEPNLIRVLERGTRARLVIDANKELDYKTKYLHISWKPFID